MKDTVEIAREVFGEILSTFPELDSNEHLDDYIFSVDIPKQDGLDFDLNLNLQNHDELHFSVSNFWCEWFPCTTPEKVAEYKKSVIGFIAGDYRVLEHFRGQRPWKAELQAPDNGSWVTVATRYMISWPVRWKKTHRVIQNAKSPR